VFAVGTTSLRVLETVARLDLPADSPPGAVRSFAAADDETVPVFDGTAHREAAGWLVRGITRLFIQPPDTVSAVDGLLTNFHLPGSSLLMLVAAFAGEATWREAYGVAVERGLRFFSYGDAMLIGPPPTETP
jgi:S-adenosylmethionine:tRNA-ribosyltransferase-isomerase (queuine synthetase)